MSIPRAALARAEAETQLAKSETERAVALQAKGSLNASDLDQAKNALRRKDGKSKKIHSVSK